MTKDTLHSPVKYSVIFFLEDQNKDVLLFMQKVREVFSSRTDHFEMIIIANGTGGVLKDLLVQEPEFATKVKAFEMSNKASQAVCLKSILKECRGEFFVVCGSYQQLTIESYEKLIEAVDSETDIISPWRQHRYDPSIYRVQSNLFNALVRWISGVKMHDLSCNVRVFRREALQKTDLYGNMYRFFPIFAMRNGFKNKEIKCEHFKEHGEPRQAKGGFYHLSVYLNRIIDIFTLYFNASFTKKPLRFFSSIGIVSIVISLGINLMILWQRITMGLEFGKRPLLILAIFLLVVGVQSASVGLLGEIIAFTHGRHKKEYIIEKII